jgi:hypothetical protein
MYKATKAFFQYSQYAVTFIIFINAFKMYQRTHLPYTRIETSKKSQKRSKVDQG